MMSGKRFPHFFQDKTCRLFPIAILLLLSGVYWVHGEEGCPQILLQRKHVSGLTFQICQADMVDNSECVRRKSQGESCPPYVLALIIKVVNQSNTKKMELIGPLRYELEDNFQNTYNLLESTRLYGQERGKVDGSTIKSLYPGNYILEKMYFEAPISAFQSLTLSINASAAGIEPPVIDLPLYKEMVRFPDRVVPPMSPYVSVIDIVRPGKDTKVKPGDVVPLQIKLNARYSRPDTVLIIAPNYTLEDVHHVYKYNIRIPDDWEPGRPYQVAILAKWGRDEDERLASESITLDVVDPRSFYPNQ